MDKADWLDVRRRVERLAAFPLTAKDCGFTLHGFQLEPVLRPHELADLERQLNVTLPADYRNFLRYVGAGGAGPSYGVFPVRRVDGRWRWIGDGADLTDPTRLDRPFPARNLDPKVMDALEEECPDWEDFPDVETFEAAYDDWQDRQDTLIWNPARTVGAICLCHHGCALRDWLVVSGPERGNIWADERADPGGDLTPHRQDGSARTTFGAWYLAWLTEVEQGPDPHPA